MEKNMKDNFELLEERVIDALNHTDLEKIRSELKKIQTPTLVTGVGGSNVVSEFTSKVLREKNKIIATNNEPRDLIYDNLYGFENVISCSYGGGNYGVELAFRNNLKKYLLSNNRYDNDEIIYLKFETTIPREKSFIALSTTLIPISIMMNYFLDGEKEKILKEIKEKKFDFDVDCDGYEIFSGIDTSTTATYLESTFAESGIGIPIVHDKYGYCHGRSTLSINYNNIAIYLNKNTQLDKLMLEELKKYYKEVIVIESKENNPILDDYQMLIQSMYLTKYIAEKKQKDLSGVDYSPLVKKLYKYKGEL